MAPERKEVVVDADPLHPQHLGKQPAQDLLLRRARRTPHARQPATPAQAAPRGRACRSASAAADPAPQTPTAPCSPEGCRPTCARSAAASDSLLRPPPPHRPPAACRQPVLARNHRRLRHRPHAASAPPRSRQARCGSRAASPAHPRAPETPAPRPHASAPDPRCGTSGSPPHQTGRQQTAPPSARHAPDSPAPAPPPQCKAPRKPQALQAATPRPIRKPACSRSDRPIGHCPVIRITRLKVIGRAATRGFSGAVMNNESGLWNVLTPRSNVSSRHALTTDHDAVG